MDLMRFVWDFNKADENEHNHQGVSFEDAVLAFFDKWSIEEYDDEHSDFEEKRFTIIGLSNRTLLRVTFTVISDKPNQEIIRIITARKAKGKEKQDYEQARNEFDR